MDLLAQFLAILILAVWFFPKSTGRLIATVHLGYLEVMDSKKQEPSKK